MKKFKIVTALALGLMTTGLVGCSDETDEIKSYTLSRNFSPVDFQCKSVSTTFARFQWDVTAGASAYVLEVFVEDPNMTFAGTPTQTITTKETSLQVDDLVYDTYYSARVRAITDGDESRSSKWSTVSFKTSAQQFMKSISENDISDRTVTASWDTSKTGSEVTALKALDAEGNVVSVKELTSDEITNGKATIGGLLPETLYTIKLYNGEKERGSQNVTTIVDLDGATIVHDTDNLKTVINDAEAGDVLALYGGTYNIPSDTEGKMGSLAITKNLTIKGIFPTNKPIIKGRFEITDGAAFSISQCVIDGVDNATGDQTFNYKLVNAPTDTKFGAFKADGCEIRNFTKGMLYGNIQATIESITFNNCIISNIECDGGDFLDIRKSYAVKVDLTNSTIYNCAQNRDFIRYDDASASYSGATPAINVDHCTINNVLNEANGKRLLYVRFVGNSIRWTNNIVSNTKAVYTNQSKTSTPTYSNNYYFGCSNANIFAPSDPEAETPVFWNGDTTGKNGEDPQFKNAAKGDFTLGNMTVANQKVGDPRWY